MKNNNIRAAVALSAGLMLLGVTSIVNRPSGNGAPHLQADGIPLPPPPIKKPHGQLMADGIPLPPPPIKKPTGQLIADGIPLPPPPIKKGPPKAV